MNEQLKSFPAIYTQQVSWGDMDALGHVNNVIYYRYIESARIHYFKDMDLFSHNVLMVISKSSCDYLSSVVYPDTLLIGAKIEEIRQSAMRMSYTLYSQQQNKVVAQAQAIMVCLDKTTHQKTAVPERLKQMIIDFENLKGNVLQLI